MPVNESPSDSMSALALFQEQEDFEQFQRDALRAMEEFRLECEAESNAELRRDQQEMEEFEEFLATRRIHEGTSAWDQFEEYREQRYRDELDRDPDSPCGWCDASPGAIFCPCLERIEEYEEPPLTGVRGTSLASTADNSDSIGGEARRPRLNGFLARLARLLNRGRGRV
jgi:hypothetical protein